MAANPELATAIIASAGRLGIHPSDLATAISYETAGTFDPWKAGPTTQWGQHRGLIQWGEPQRQKYGVTEGMPVGAQLEAAEKYLIDAGVKPGMGLLDIYSAINAGRVGRYNASDANNGGAPGTVADKVATQMIGHRLNANRLLGLPQAMPQSMPGTLPQAPRSAPPGPLPGVMPSAAAETAPTPGGAPAPASGPAIGDSDMQQLLAMVRQQLQQGDEMPAMQPMALPDLHRQRRARMIAAALKRSKA